MPKKVVIKKKRTVKYNKKPKVSKTIKNYVKRELHREVENKEYVYYTYNQPIITANASYPTTEYHLLPVLVNGTGTAQRIGDKIRILRATMSGVISLLPYNIATNPYVGPVMVKMFICSYIPNHEPLVVNTNANQYFFNAGGSYASFQGDVLDMDLPINKQQWKLHKTKIFTLGVSSPSTSTATNTNFYDNRNSSVKYRINYTKYCKKQLMYPDATSSFAQNDMLYCIFQAVYPDGTVSSSASRLAEYSMVNHVYYEDA
nr:MAG: capsid protein [Cressdnaviricota sp.]